MDNSGAGQIRRAEIDLAALTQGELLELDQPPWRKLVQGDMIVLRHSDGSETTLHVDQELEDGNKRVTVGPPRLGVQFELHFIGESTIRAMMNRETAQTLLDLS